MRQYKIVIIAWIGLFIFNACRKNNDLSTGPYVETAGPAVQFYGKKPSPVSAGIGEQVTYQVSGLKSLKTEFQFFINQVEAEIVNITDSLVTLKVPDNASTGPASVQTADGQYFFGPTLKIDGRVSVDSRFDPGLGANGSINDLYYSASGQGAYMLVGGFDNYNNQKSQNPVNGIVKIGTDGKYQAYNAGFGAMDGFIGTILHSDGQFLVGGFMGNYNKMNVANLAALNDDASLKTKEITVVNPDSTRPENNKDTVPVLNRYIGGYVTRLFKHPDGGNIAIGNFRNAYSFFYDRSEKDNYYTDFINAGYIIKFNDEGVFDSSYNFDKNASTPFGGLKGKSILEPNGSIIDAVQLPGNKIIIVGSFTRLSNSARAPGIAALTNEGLQDMGFAASAGTGANGSIGTINYNAATKKIMITGGFTTYNGQPANGVAMLNEDGSLDPGFRFLQYTGGFPNYAAQLKNGKVIVSGSFSTYGGVIRQGFIILNPDGTLAPGYNNTGAFRGSLAGVFETPNNGVLLYGSFNLFDNKSAGSIVQILLDDH